jgi:DNA invertase Pin-like site-specific DNA recombinase
MAQRVPFVVAELGPEVDPVVLHLYAALAEKERAMISRRTKDALRAAKARGVVLGNPRLSEAREAAKASQRAAKAGHEANVRPIIEEIKRSGAVILRAIADALNARGVQTARGGGGMPNRSRESWADRRQAYFRPRWPGSSWGARHEASTRPIAEREDHVARQLAAARRRKRATGVKVDGRKSHAEARPEVVKRAQELAQPKGQRGLSLRAISKALAAEGHLNERGKPFAAKSVASMLASQPKASARRRAPRRPTARRPSPA